MQEVTGSNPVSSTIDYQGFVRCTSPFFVPSKNFCAALAQQKRENRRFSCMIPLPAFRYLLLFALLSTVSCKEEDKPVNPIPDDALVFAFYTEDPRVYYLHDPVKHRIYAIEAPGNGNIIVYDYLQKKVVETASKKLRETFNDREAALGTVNGKNELYIAQNKTIVVYNADLLFRFDSINLPDSLPLVRISALDNLRDSFLFVGGCGTPEWPPQAPKARLLNRPSKQIVPAIHQSDYCADIYAFEDLNSAGQKEFGVLSMGFHNIPPRFTIERYDSKGALLDSKSREYQPLPYGIKPCEVGDDVPYVILEVNGQVYSKKDLSLIDSLGGLYHDYYVPPKGEKIYALKPEGTIDVFGYPGLQKIKTIPAPALGIRQQNLLPYHLFSDGEHLIMVFTRREGVRGSTHIAVVDF